MKKSKVTQPEKPLVANTTGLAPIVIAAGPGAFAAGVDVPVPVGIETRCRNRVALHNIACDRLLRRRPLPTARRNPRCGEGR